MDANDMTPQQLRDLAYKKEQESREWMAAETTQEVFDLTPLMDFFEDAAEDINLCNCRTVEEVDQLGQEFLRVVNEVLEKPVIPVGSTVYAMKSKARKQFWSVDRYSNNGIQASESSSLLKNLRRHG